MSFFWNYVPNLITFDESQYVTLGERLVLVSTTLSVVTTTPADADVMVWRGWGEGGNGGRSTGAGGGGGGGGGGAYAKVAICVTPGDEFHLRGTTGGATRPTYIATSAVLIADISAGAPDMIGLAPAANDGSQGAPGNGASPSSAPAFGSPVGFTPFFTSGEQGLGGNDGTVTSGGDGAGNIGTDVQIPGGFGLDVATCVCVSVGFGRVSPNPEAYGAAQGGTGTIDSATTGEALGTHRISYLTPGTETTAFSIVSAINTSAEWVTVTCPEGATALIVYGFAQGGDGGDSASVTFGGGGGGGGGGFFRASINCTAGDEFIFGARFNAAGTSGLPNESIGFGRRPGGTAKYFVWANYAEDGGQASAAGFGTAGDPGGAGTSVLTSSINGSVYTASGTSGFRGSAAAGGRGGNLDSQGLAFAEYLLGDPRAGWGGHTQRDATIQDGYDGFWPGGAGGGAFEDGQGGGEGDNYLVGYWRTYTP